MDNVTSLLAQIDKYLAGGQTLKSLTKWMTDNPGIDVDPKMQQLVDAVSNDVIKFSVEHMITEKQLRKDWKRLVARTRFGSK